MVWLLIVLHVLGAAIWVGGHLVLCLTVLPRALRAADPSIIRDFEAAYERIGVPALFVQVLSGLWLAYLRIPQVADWFVPASSEAWLVLMKLVLLASTVMLAVHARLRIVPGLDRDHLRPLAYHIVMVTLLEVGLLVLGVVLRTTGQPS